MGKIAVDGNTRIHIALGVVSVAALLIAGFSASSLTLYAAGQAENRVEPIACETGARGAQGLSGAPGASGAPGKPGASGAPGQTGETGPSGAPGPSGSTGPQGETGPSGAPGASGAAGQTGATGPQGPAGADGVCVTLAPTSTGLGYFGAFYSKVSQNNDALVNKMTFDSTQIAAGVSIVDDSKITFANAGTYNLAFSAQFDKTDSGRDTVDVWLSNSSGAISWSNTKLDNNNNDGKVVAAWNFFVTVAAGEFVELNWYSPDPSMRVYAQGAATNPTRPEIPSVILTVNQVH